MFPFKFQPYLKPTIWGGESWQVSGVPGHESVTADRGLADDADLGKTLPDLIDAYRERLVGGPVYRKFGSRFPLLVKFIDARQDLSVQVHPDDALALKRHGAFGKTEMWYVLRTGPGAKICSGLSRAITPDEYVRLAAEGDAIRSVLAYRESRAGDLFYLPAGRLHAIGAGNFLVEIQETSDITYRVYDYGRRDAEGRTRELHTALAKDAIDGRASDGWLDYEREKPLSLLVDCPHFTVHRAIVQDAARLDFATPSFVLAVCLEGAATVNGVGVRQGETLLVPAEENILDIRGTASFLTAFVAD